MLDYPDATEYQMRIRNATGTLQAVLSGSAYGGSPKKGGYLDFTYTKRVNAAGLLAFTLDGDSDASALIADNGIIEIWRRNIGAGIDWYRDFTGIVRRRRWETDNSPRLIAYAPGPNYLLQKRHILWYAGTAYRSAFTADPAETVASTLVSYNAASNATTTAGRLRSGVTVGLSTETAGTAGTVVDWYCAYDNLLASLQDLAKIAGGDFDTVQTGDATFEWRWYDGQLGTDRTATVIFALERGNMAHPVYEDDGLEETNVVIALGQGEESSRATAIETAGDADAEVVIDARSIETSTGLGNRASAKLIDGQRKRTFSFDSLQTPSCLYGKHYFLGDLVTARYSTAQGEVISTARKITAVTVTFDEEGRETVAPEFGRP